MIEQFMITLLNMSFAASVMIVIVLPIRLLIRRLPKWYSYALWGLVLFRLLCPFSFSSAFSLFPANHRPIADQIIYENMPFINSGILFIDEPVNRTLMRNMAAEPASSINPIQMWLFLFFMVWVAGVVLILGINMILYMRLKKQLKTAVRTESCVFESDRVTMPMVLGLFHPAIYLPFGLAAKEKGYILTHERTHIRRWDYQVKLLSFFILALHWFNPLVWAAFLLMCKDMEMSCDERVLKELGMDEKSGYSMALLRFTATKSGVMLPMAFGESNTKSRIRNVLNYKKTAFWISAAAVFGLVAAAVVFMTNPSSRVGEVAIIGGSDGPTSIFIAGKNGHDPLTDKAVPVDIETLKEIELPQPKENDDFESSQTGISLDFASDERVVFHGTFGLFIFEKQNGSFGMTHSLDYAKMDSRFRNAAGIEVLDLKSQVIIAEKTGESYGAVCIYNPENETLQNADALKDGIPELKKTLKDSGDGNEFTGVMAGGKQGEGRQEDWRKEEESREAADDEIKVYDAHTVDGNKIGIIAAYGTRADELWYGVYDKNLRKMVRMNLFQ